MGDAMPVIVLIVGGLGIVPLPVTLLAGLSIVVGAAVVGQGRRVTIDGRRSTEPPGIVAGLLSALIAAAVGVPFIYYVLFVVRECFSTKWCETIFEMPGFGYANIEVYRSEREAYLQCLGYGAVGVLACLLALDRFATVLRVLYRRAMTVTRATVGQR